MTRRKWGPLPARLLWVCVLLAGGIALAFMLPLPDGPWGNDGSIHAANVCLLSASLDRGELLPRWHPELNGGRGGPNFRYYSTFAYYPAALMVRAGQGVVSALRLTCRLWFVVGFAGLGLLAWSAYGRCASLCASLLFCLSPYVLTLVQARCALPEFAALCVAPWAFYCVECWANSGRETPRVLLSAMVCLLLCVHNLAALLWVPLLLLSVLCFSWRKGMGATARGMGSVCAGAALAAFQFAPSVLELSWIDAARQFGDAEGLFQWAIPPLALLSNRPGAGFSARLVPGPLVLTAMVVACVLLCLQQRQKPGTAQRGHRVEVVFLIVALSSLVLTTKVCAVVAAMVWPLRYVQFPWRFLGPVALCGGMVGAGLCHRLAWPLRCCVCAAVFVIAWGCLLPEYGGVIPATWPVQQRDELMQTVMTGDYENKYTPLGARLLPVPAAGSVEMHEGMAVLSVDENGSGLRVELDAAEDGFIVIKRYWFPGWRARVDGAPAAVRRDALNGYVKVWLPAGVRRVEIWREGRLLDRLYTLVSLTAVLGVASAWMTQRRRWLGWVPCVAVSAVTLIGGMLGEEGFRPDAQWREELECDRLAADARVHGWSVVHYVSGVSEEEKNMRRGSASCLNLLPGGFLRSGTGVWAADLCVPAGWDAAFQCVGRVVATLGGKPYALDGGEGVTLDGLRLVPIASEVLQGVTRVVVIASEIGPHTAVRLLVRRPGGRGPWQLPDRQWLRPAVNRGYREVFTEPPDVPGE